MRISNWNFKVVLIIILCVAVAGISIMPFVDFKSDSGKIKLIVDLHGYTPSKSRIPTAEDPDVFNSTYFIAEAFMDENPDVEIEWAYTKPVGGLDAEIAQWFTTQIAGGTVPAIAFSWGTRYQERDWYLPLDDYLETEWTYSDDYDVWKDVFRDYLWQSASVVNAREEIVGLPITVFPGSATGYFYNKNIFQASGIESVPLTWNQFLTTAKTVKDNGYIGVAPWSLFNTSTIFDAWVWGSIFSSSFGGYVMETKNTDYDGNGRVTAAEAARACLEGHFSTTQHEYAKEVYRLLKEYYTKTLEPSWGSIEYYGDWLDGNVGMREEGIWAIPVENSTHKEFDFGVFVAPLISTDTTPYVNEIQFSNGPHEPEPDLVVNIMKSGVQGKPEVLDAAIRFLKFLTQPDNVSMICLENAGVLGAVKNTGHSALIDEFIRQKFPISPNASWPSGFTDENKDVLNRMFESWLNNAITDAEFYRRVDDLQVAGAKDFIAKMGINTAGWTINY